MLFILTSRDIVAKSIIFNHSFKFSALFWLSFLPIDRQAIIPPVATHLHWQGLFPVEEEDAACEKVRKRRTKS